VLIGKDDVRGKGCAEEGRGGEIECLYGEAGSENDPCVALT